MACARVATILAPSPADRSYDVIIENGRIVDGTGNLATSGDIGIRGDRIAAVTLPGVLRSARAKQRVNARGHVVAPGFIDIQAQSWNALLSGDGRVVSKVTQGVTTEILGEATTYAPSNQKIEALLGIEAMTPARAALQRSFTGRHAFGAWLDAMGRHANSTNVGSYLGATTVRAYV